MIYLYIMEEKKDMLIRNVNVKLKNEFRALCVKQGKTLTEEIQRLMKEELEKAEKKK